MRGHWQGSACFVPPCPRTPSQSRLLHPLPAPAGAQPRAVPAATLADWLCDPLRLCHPPGPLQALILGWLRVSKGCHGAELGSDIAVGKPRPQCDGAWGCLGNLIFIVPGLHGEKPGAAATHRRVAMPKLVLD